MPLYRRVVDLSAGSAQWSQDGIVFMLVYMPLGRVSRWVSGEPSVLELLNGSEWRRLSRRNSEGGAGVGKRSSRILLSVPGGVQTVARKCSIAFSSPSKSLRYKGHGFQSISTPPTNVGEWLGARKELCQGKWISDFDFRDLRTPTVRCPARNVEGIEPRLSATTPCVCPAHPGSGGTEGNTSAKILLGPPRRVGEVAPEVEKNHFNDRRSPPRNGASCCG